MTLDIIFVTFIIIILSAFGYFVYTLGYQDGRKDGYEDGVEDEKIKKRQEERVNFIEAD